MQVTNKLVDVITTSNESLDTYHSSKAVKQLNDEIFSLLVEIGELHTKELSVEEGGAVWKHTNSRRLALEAQAEKLRALRFNNAFLAIPTLLGGL